MVTIVTEGDAWYLAPFHAVDGMLSKVSAKLQKILRILRLAQVGVAFLFLLPIFAAMSTIWFAWMAPYVLILFAVYLAVPLIGVYIILGFPLKASSVKRLVDMGYPANAKEFAIRAAARKLHEQSIETEELLLETAINESKKALKKYRARAQKVRKDLDADSPGGSDVEDDE
jgi:hypothetical protein